MLVNLVVIDIYEELAQRKRDSRASSGRSNAREDGGERGEVKEE